MKLKIDNTFSQELPADKVRNNSRRQVREAAFSYVTPRVPSAPTLVHVAPAVAEMLGINQADLTSETFVNIFSGKEQIADTEPYAMCYGGHQFGHWAGQLGDGRAINLAEILHKNQRWAVQLKGSGETPYSRTADGLAVLRSSIREHLCSEAMYYLGVPTTRSLSIMKTGDTVLRDMLYDGNSAYEQGAVVCRVAPSFIRFGNFQIFAARKEVDNLRKLADYTIKHFYPAIKLGEADAYAQFFQAVAQRTLKMVIEWQRVGFVHGVMNTDNMSILGLTIDYGPYGWLEGFDPDWTPNTTDNSQKRYRYGYQPNIALWNLLQLANALFLLMDDSAALEATLEEYKNNFAIQYPAMMRQKLGLVGEVTTDIELARLLEDLLQLTETDMTIFYRKLADFKPSELEKGIDLIQSAFYKPAELTGDTLGSWEAWLQAYAKRLGEQKGLSDADRKQAMNKVNPKYVLRNYMAQLAIDAANKGDYSIVEELYKVLQKPYDEQVKAEKWFAKRPEWARNKVGCSMLSCSS